MGPTPSSPGASFFILYYIVDPLDYTVMPSSSFTIRTNSLAFAKTDCHTCTTHQRQCDRRRPRCSTCSGQDILCGGYPMQLTWPKSKPVQPRAKSSGNHGNDPFYIEPLSLQTSNHAQNRPNRSLYQSYRKLAFVTEKFPDLKQRHTSSSNVRNRKKPASPCEISPRPPSRRRSISRDTSSHDSLLGHPSLVTASTDVFGESDYAL